VTIGVPILIWLVTIAYAFTTSGAANIKHCRLSTVQALTGALPLCVAGETADTAAAASSSEVGEKTVEYARKQLGLPYVTGGPTNGSISNPNNFDCSGLSRDAVLWATGGRVNLVHHAATQYAQLARHSVPKNDPAAWAPGDLIYYFVATDISIPGHVAIYIGDGNVIEAPRPGQSVLQSPVAQGPGTYIMGVRRPSEAFTPRPGRHATPATADTSRRVAA
jgi:cell wall-associated NlpC family hydrolase